MVLPYVSDTNWDSWLQAGTVSATRNADLILIVRVALVRRDPAPGYSEGTVQDVGNAQVTILRWESEQWEQFKSDFKTNIEQAWNDRLWLVPSADCGLSIRQGNAIVRPNVKCGVSIRVVDERDDHHTSVRCVNLKPRQRHRSGWSGYNVRPADGYDGFFDSRDVTAGGQLHQIPVAHEFGHYLGLLHVATGYPGSHCTRDDQFARQCYGVTAHQRGDIMGAGMRVERWHAAPWLHRITQHVGQGVRWEVVAGHRPAPRRVPRISPNLDPRPSDRTNFAYDFLAPGR
jgi:hypothetical protein